MAITKLNFYKRHYNAVVRDILPNLPRNSRKLIDFWNVIFSMKQKSYGDTITNPEFLSLIAVAKAKIEGLTSIDIESDDCIAKLGCFFWHDPLTDFEVHRMAGGFERIHKAKGEKEIIIIRDINTGEEFILRERGG